MALIDKWTTWRERPFPSSMADVEIAGVCVTSVDSFAAGCLTTYFERRALDGDRVRILKKCARELKRALPEIPDDCREYFEDLADLCSGVVLAMAAPGRA